MLFSGQAIKVSLLPSGIAQLIFDLEGSSVNKFDRLTMKELGEATAVIGKSDARGVIFSSAKSTFIVGADITEFTGLFATGSEAIRDWIGRANEVFNAIEDLPLPTVAAINGVALGGGFELALSADYRVALESAVVGFPEVKLGILPGFGGTVRLPRLIGSEKAIAWISQGSHIPSRIALAEKALDAIVANDDLIAAAERIIEDCLNGSLDYTAQRVIKTSPVLEMPETLAALFTVAKPPVVKASGPHYPAPLTAVEVMEKGVLESRAGALAEEHKGFIQLAGTNTAANLVQMFLNDQFLASKSRALSKGVPVISRAAVLGAGIMGGGIAYQSALRGKPIVMKDIAQAGLDLGINEAQTLVAKQVKRGKMTTESADKIIGSITPSLAYEDLAGAELVVEAVVENESVKKSVLAELESIVADDAIIATNTSTISVDSLATALNKPERFCGMHFFNPVPLMPLVEVIRGQKTSKETIASTVAYAKALGKTPIVVNNCPGFLVNRILFPYFGAFSTLVYEGADFRQIDRVMEEFGWPMGPAYLLDVVGIDTAVHAQAVMAAGFARMKLGFESAIDKLYSQGDLGQKSGRGFYEYVVDENGRIKKQPNPEIDALIAGVSAKRRNFSDNEIRDRMMLALCLETVRCLEDGIVETAIEADMGLVLGLGFPKFRGGALRFIDQLGLAEFCELADSYAHLGPMLAPTAKLREMAEAKLSYYSQ
ncbi:MAG: fatty acid oxidation complex subunit alpha FadB [Proteobacteria bacterium]|nr:fatty acid oxidation complex subunit alpha FadB [Pseudomonadota bacterium]MDA1245061.1 fatty acid oxidation complex subunit alpha FadB [Pseudomonadota bacterium]